jgi:hypothetical protein
VPAGPIKPPAAATAPTRPEVPAGPIKPPAAATAPTRPAAPAPAPAPPVQTPPALDVPTVNPRTAPGGPPPAAAPKPTAPPAGPIQPPAGPIKPPAAAAAPPPAAAPKPTAPPATPAAPPALDIPKVNPRTTPGGPPPAAAPKPAAPPAKPAAPPAKPAAPPALDIPKVNPRTTPGAPPPAAAPKPTATKPPDVTPAPPSASPVKPPAAPPPAATPVTKLPPIAAGSIAAGSVGQSIANSMAERESAGNTPDSYFKANFVQGGDTHGKKKSRFGNQYRTSLDSNEIFQGNINIVTGLPFEKSLTEMTMTEVVELANERSKYFKKSGAGAAMGKYQFMPGTLTEHVKKVFGPKGMDQLFSEENQELLMQSLLQQNAKKLMTAGIPLTDANLYLMHFFGNATQASMVINGKDSDSMGAILDYFWEKKDDNYKSKYKRPSVANPYIAKLTVDEYKKLLAKSFNYKEVTYKMLTESATFPTLNDNENSNPTDSERRQSNIQKASQVLINNNPILRNMINNENAKNDNVNVNINAPTSVINKQNPKQSISKPTSSDKPAIAGIP